MAAGHTVTLGERCMSGHAVAYGMAFTSYAVATAALAQKYKLAFRFSNCSDFNLSGLQLERTSDRQNEWNVTLVFND